MPYALKKDGPGYKVVSTDSGDTHSKKTLPRQRALAQMRAMYANTKDIPGRARGGRINLSGKQKKKKTPEVSHEEQANGNGTTSMSPPIS